MKATERIYLNNARTKAVSEDDPDVGSLFAVEGDEVSDEDAKKYGIKAAAAEKADAKAVAAPSEDKAEAGPAETKAARGS